MVTFTVVDTTANAPIGTFAEEELAFAVADEIGQLQGIEHLAVQVDDGHGHWVVIAKGWEVVDRAREAQLVSWL